MISFETKQKLAGLGFFIIIICSIIIYNNTGYSRTINTMPDSVTMLKMSMTERARLLDYYKKTIIVKTTPIQKKQNYFFCGLIGLGFFMIILWFNDGEGVRARREFNENVLKEIKEKEQKEAEKAQKLALRESAAEKAIIATYQNLGKDIKGKELKAAVKKALEEEEAKASKAAVETALKNNQYE
jgi:hypothetical protein